MVKGTGDRRWQRLLSADLCAESRDSQPFTLNTKGKQPLLGNYLDTSDSNTISSASGDSEPVLDWPSLLRWREREAQDFAESACEKDKHLIGLYLPSLRRALRRESSQNPQSDCSPDCKWTPPVVDNTLSSRATGIKSHLLEHFREVHFTEVVETAFGNSSESIERLYACARHINDWYQSSSQLQSEYEPLRDVSPIRAYTNMSADQTSRNLLLNIPSLTTSSLLPRVVMNLRPIILDSA
jgi:hypothetical protein